MNGSIAPVGVQRIKLQLLFQNLLYEAIALQRSPTSQSENHRQTELVQVLPHQLFGEGLADRLSKSA